MSGPTGLILSLCLFLPAVKGCSGPVYPYEIPAAYGPYLFGLLIAIGSLRLPAQAAAAVRLITWVWGATATALGAGVLGHTLLKADAPGVREDPIPLLLIVLGLPPGVVLLRSLRWRRDPDRLRAELLLGGGALCLLFCLYWVFTMDTYFGMWLATLASALLLTEGVYRRATQAPPVAPPPLSTPT